MLLNDVLIVDTDARLWSSIRPLLDVALRLEREDQSWYGWSRQPIDAFLQRLPEHCSLLAGVWDGDPGVEEEQEEEQLVIGLVCEVLQGQICSVRTFASLALDGLSAPEQLEPGFEHAREVMRAAKQQIAPVAWALFTDKRTWDEWIFSQETAAQEKGALLQTLARQGRCVLMGSQAMHHHS